MTPPASMRAGRGDHQANGAGQSLHDLARPNPPQRIDNRSRLVHGVRPLRQGYRLPRRQGDRTELQDRFPNYSQIRSRVRLFRQLSHVRQVWKWHRCSTRELLVVDSIVWRMIGSQRCLQMRRGNTWFEGQRPSAFTNRHCFGRVYLVSKEQCWAMRRVPSRGW